MRGKCWRGSILRLPEFPCKELRRRFRVGVQRFAQSDQQRFGRQCSEAALLLHRCLAVQFVLGTLRLASEQGSQAKEFFFHIVGTTLLLVGTTQFNLPTGSEFIYLLQ